MIGHEHVPPGVAFLLLVLLAGGRRRARGLLATKGQRAEERAFAPFLLELADVPGLATLLLLALFEHGVDRVAPPHRQRRTQRPPQVVRGTERDSGAGIHAGDSRPQRIQPFVLVVVVVGHLVEAGQRRHDPLLLGQTQGRTIAEVVVVMAAAVVVMAVTATRRYDFRHANVGRRHFRGPLQLAIATKYNTPRFWAIEIANSYFTHALIELKRNIETKFKEIARNYIETTLNSRAK